MKVFGGILILLGILWAIAFLPILLLGSSYPTASFVAPLVCGSGYEISSETTSVQGSRGTRIGTSMECVNPETGETGELTSMFLILATVPGVVMGVIGMALMNLGSLGGFGGMKEMGELMKVPEVKAQIDPLIAELQAGNISYEDYLQRQNEIIANYKAKQGASAQ